MRVCNQEISWRNTQRTVSCKWLWSCRQRGKLSSCLDDRWSINIKGGLFIWGSINWKYPGVIVRVVLSVEWKWDPVEHYWIRTRWIKEFRRSPSLWVSGCYHGSEYGINQDFKVRRKDRWNNLCNSFIQSILPISQIKSNSARQLTYKRYLIVISEWNNQPDLS
jgi:hypothetical protein